MLVRDFVQTELVHIHSDATLFEAAEKILAHNVETLLVFENDRLVGVVGLRISSPSPDWILSALWARDREIRYGKLA